MKKIYFAPNITVMTINATLMYATSGFNSALNETGGDGTNILSRDGGGFFDDDDF